ncbi:MAG: AEC family transporter [Verrucomicrobiales bacterium]
MIPVSLILPSILPVYGMMVMGLLLRHFKVLTPEMEGGLLKLGIHCLMPCLILDKVLGNELVRRPEVVASGVGIGFLLIVSGYLVSHLVGGLLGLQKGAGKRTFTLAGGIQNYGYVAIPILMVLFRDGGSDRVLGLLFIHSLGVEIALWVVGLMVLSGNFLKNPKVFLNGPIVAIVIGILFSYTGIWPFFEPREEGVHLGSVIRQVMSWLGICAFPIGLLLAGATMYDMFSNFKPSLKVSCGALLVRLGLMPIIMLALAKYLPVVTELKQIMVVQAAMPAAVAPIIIARHYGGKTDVAIQVALVTAAGALLTMPLWIAWGMGYVFD